MTHSQNMLAISIASAGGPEVLKPVDVPRPQIGPRDVLIQIAAAGVNGPDLAQRRGHYAPPPDASPLPGLEVAGRVVACGPEVTGFSVGDRVMALTNGGGYAEYVAVPFGQVLPIPAGWSFAEAAALPETWFTVTQTLVMRSGLEAGMWVLVHGGAGGIGSAAIQIARLLGAKPIAVVSSPTKADYCRSLGAVDVIDRSTDDIVERVNAITGGHGADRIVDIVGGTMAAINVAASARRGHIVQISTLEGGTASVPLRQMMAKEITLSGSTLRPQTSATKAEIAGRIRQDLLPRIGGDPRDKPSVTTFPLEAASKAHETMEARQFQGKLVLLTAFGVAETAI